MGNKNLNSAKKAKNDEFYTQLADIERECFNYKEHFQILFYEFRVLWVEKTYYNWI